MGSLQGCQTDSRQARAEAEEEAEGSSHDLGVGADQVGIQQGQYVKELVLGLRPVTLKNLQHVTLTPNITFLQPETRTACQLLKCLKAKADCKYLLILSAETNENSSDKYYLYNLTAALHTCSFVSRYIAIQCILPYITIFHTVYRQCKNIRNTSCFVQSG